MNPYDLQILENDVEKRLIKNHKKATLFFGVLIFGVFFYLLGLIYALDYLNSLGKGA